MAIPLSFPRGGVPVIMGLVLAGILVLPATAQSTPQADVTRGTPLTSAGTNVDRLQSGSVMPVLRISQVYDGDMIFAPGQGTIGGTYTVLDGEIRYVHKRPSDNWLLNLRGGGWLYPRYPELNTSLEDGSLQWQHRFSNSFDFTASQRWASLPGGGVEDRIQVGQMQMLSAPDTVTELLARKRTTMESNIVFSYRPTGRLTFLVGGNYNDTKFAFTDTSFRSTAYDAYGQLYYRVSQNQNAGLALVNQWIGFPGQGERAQVRNLLLSYSNQLTPTLSLYVYGGPSRLQEHTIQNSVVELFGTPTHLTREIDHGNYGAVGGAALRKTLGRNQLQLEYSRMYTRGGGFNVTTLRESEGVTLSRQFSRRLNVAVTGSYALDKAQAFSGSDYRSYQAEPQIRYKYTSRLVFVLTGAYARALPGSGLSSFTRTIATAGVEYSFHGMNFGR
jgi:hypothetical protein